MYSLTLTYMSVIRGKTKSYFETKLLSKRLESVQIYGEEEQRQTNIPGFP